MSDVGLLRKRPKGASTVCGENRTVTPLRRKNAERRPREYLTHDEVDKLVAARQNHYGHRDAA